MVDFRSEENLLRSAGAYVSSGKRWKRRAPWILFGLIIATIIGLWIVERGRLQAMVRDSARLRDMHTLQAGFETLFRESFSYSQAAESGCSQVRDAVSKCRLESVLPNIASIRDPGGSAYIVTQAPNEQNYEITFTLERAYGDLPAGRHTLDSNGLH